MDTVETLADRLTVREAAGVFRTKDSLERAIKTLLTSGFDRSDIDILGDTDVLLRRLGTTVPVEELADIPDAPRHSLVTREDQRLTAIAVFQTLFAVGALAGGAAVVTSGGSVPSAIVVAVVAGLTAGLIGFGLSRRLLRSFERLINDNLAAGGLILWVRVQDPEHEWRAVEILQNSGADAVRIHEIEIGKPISDLPLARARPDPALKQPTH